MQTYPQTRLVPLLEHRIVDVRHKAVRHILPVVRLDHLLVDRMGLHALHICIITRISKISPITICRLELSVGNIEDCISYAEGQLTRTVVAP